MLLLAITLFGLQTGICFGKLGQDGELPRVSVENGNFIETETGRVLMFRGINSVVKHYPWYDEKLLDPKRQQQLEDWGFNAIRLGMMWTGFEPEEKQINETYAGIIQEIVDGLGQHGIYSYLDMHQDVLKEPGYFGIPPWVVDKMDPPRHAYPWPFKDESGYGTWACGYFTEEMSNGFEQLYTNVGGTADDFANFWREVALRFKDRSAILGYELMNEPWTGDIYADTSVILPGNAGYNLLQPFFERASQAIRSVDDTTIVFWEPVTYAYFVYSQANLILDSVVDAFLKANNMSLFYPALTQLCGELADDAFSLDATTQNSGFSVLEESISELIQMAELAMGHRFNQVDLGRDNIKLKPSVFGPGFTAPPGGMDYINRTAMSWHYYCWALPSADDGSYDPLLRAVCDDFLGPMVFRTVDERADDLGRSATFLTEFGTCYPNSTDEDAVGTIECNFVLDQADAHLESWSYWDTAGGGVFWDGEGNPIEETVRVFSRPYPPATAGTPTYLYFNHLSRYFNFRFKPNHAISHLPTEVFIPPLIFPDEKYSIKLSDGLRWEKHPDSANKILIWTTSPDLVEGEVVIQPSPNPINA